MHALASGLCDRAMHSAMTTHGVGREQVFSPTLRLLAIGRAWFSCVGCLRSVCPLAIRANRTQHRDGVTIASAATQAGGSRAQWRRSTRATAGLSAGSRTSAFQATRACSAELRS